MISPSAEDAVMVAEPTDIAVFYRCHRWIVRLPDKRFICSVVGQDGRNDRLLAARLHGQTGRIKGDRAYIYERFFVAEGEVVEGVIRVILSDRKIVFSSI